jgi:hypothetical protein
MSLSLCAQVQSKVVAETAPPELREYARRMYPNELDDDLIIMIEDLIERRRVRKYGEKDS